MLHWKGDTNRGATVVEFAVIAPLLLLILFGIIEYGIIFMQVHMVENAAREGVRRGVVADTYNCWQGGEILNRPDCLVDRYTIVVETVQDYLKTFYPDLSDNPNDINFVTVTKEPPPPETGTRKWLIVKVETENFMPKFVSALLGERFNLEKITYTARGEYENPDEP
ncbi:TadE family protein [Thermodesulfobacteriota bacterium]